MGFSLTDSVSAELQEHHVSNEIDESMAVLLSEFNSEEVTNGISG